MLYIPKRCASSWRTCTLGTWLRTRWPPTFPSRCLTAFPRCCPAEYYIFWQCRRIKNSCPVAQTVGVAHEASQQGMPQTNGFFEREVHDLLIGTRATSKQQITQERKLENGQNSKSNKNRASKKPSNFCFWTFLGRGCKQCCNFYFSQFCHFCYTSKAQ